MTAHPSVSSPLRKPLRLWPGVSLGVLILVLRFLPPYIAPPLFEADTAMMVVLIAFLGAILASVLVLLWWLFFSRAPWVERFLALGLVAVGFLRRAARGRRLDHHRRDGDALRHPGDPDRGTRLRGLGGADAALHRWRAPRDDGGGDPAGLLVAGPDPHRRLHRQHETRLRLALDADAGRAPARRRSERAATGRGAGAHGRARRRTGERTGSRPGVHCGRPAPACGRRGADSHAGGDAAHHRQPPAWCPRTCRRRPGWPSGRASADRAATGSCAARASRPTGARRRRSRCGAAPSGRAGRRSRSPAIASTRRNSAARTKWSRATTRRPARRCGSTATARASGNRTAAPARAARRP